METSLKYFYPLLLSLVLLPLGLVSSPANATEVPERTASQISQSPLIQRVNINSASAEDIAATVKGIGFKKAQAIIEWRDAYGQFTAIEQLSEVNGIGKKTLERIKPYITF